MSHSLQVSGKPPVGPRRIVEWMGGPENPEYSLCAMVTKWDEYKSCKLSFEEHGFDSSSCEFLTIDNSSHNRSDAYVAVNEFLQAASGQFVIIHHQDIMLRDHGRRELDTALEELTTLNPNWAICGNAGQTAEGWPAICISHPHRDHDVRGGPFPVPVVSVDENFIVVRRVANLAVSADLTGFHHYGVDLCTIADILGWRSYVIGFFLRHNSGGTFDYRYEASRRAIEAKYKRALRSRWGFLITSHHFLISASRLRHVVSPWVRRGSKALGIVPRDYELEDPEFCAYHNPKKGRRYWNPLVRIRLRR